MNNGWRLFLQAFNMVRNNIGYLARTTLPIWLALSVILAMLGLNISFSFELGTVPSIGFLSIGLLVALIYLIATTWIAVFWHRYVLLEEMPASMLPTFDRRLIGKYLWAAFLNGLLTMLIMFAVVFAFSMLSAVLSMIGFPVFLLSPVFGVFWVLAIVWLSFRLGVRLPGIAIGRHMGMMESWTISQPFAGSIFAVAGLIAVAAVVFGIFETLILGSLGMVGGIIGVFVEWLILLFMASVLTALYGHIVEKRPI